MTDTFRGVIVFGGPSLPGEVHLRTYDVRPPVHRGALDALDQTDPSIVVVLDGAFLHLPPTTHAEFLRCLERHAVVGAASIGALRATELRQYGMIGMGTAYRAFLQGVLKDDSELALSCCPFSFKAQSVPLIHVRRLLALAIDCGISKAAASEFLTTASAIPFLERNEKRLLQDWSRLKLADTQTLARFLSDPQIELKRHDAVGAITFALMLSRGSHANQTFTKVPIFVDGEVIAV